MSSDSIGMESESSALEFNTEEETDFDYEEDIDNTGEALANLTEEQENRVQMDQIRRMTIEPGLMKLPVGNVTTADNSEKWVIELEHPVEGTHRLFFDKPLQGYSSDYKIVQLMDWYGVESGSPYDLQFHSINARYDPDESDWAHGWTLERPESYSPPIRQQLSEKWRSIDLGSYRPNMTGQKMYAFLLTGALLGPLFSGSMPAFIGDVVSSLITTAVLFGVMTIAGLIALDK